VRIKQVGLAAGHRLVIHWWCLGCRKAMYVVRDLTECWEECPAEPEWRGAREPHAELDRHPGDARFLQSMGIRFPGEEEK
jgi:hypothetical protein